MKENETNLLKNARGKSIYLTDAEIEYIRRSLINEGANNFYQKNSIKDEILKKLNN